MAHFASAVKSSSRLLASCVLLTPALLGMLVAETQWTADEHATALRQSIREKVQLRRKEQIELLLADLRVVFERCLFAELGDVLSECPDDMWARVEAALKKEWDTLKDSLALRSSRLCSRVCRKCMND